MNEHVNLNQRLSTDKPISVAILAMGGQGGGVLADWIVAMAEEQGWMAQTSSVPGVAQRTGATIYYLEMLPARDGHAPIFSLMPTPGDVDIVLAAELMEAGRSVLRGLVTPDKTTLIASTHRSFAVGEKEKPGDGTANPVVVTDATDFAAKRTIAFDMETLATKNGSVISASMFGALAGSGALPFGKPAFEAVIRSGGKGIEASLRAFNAAFERASGKPNDPVSATPHKRFDALPETAGHPDLDRLVNRIRAEFPEQARPLLFAGVKKLTDFQDPAYAGEYLDRVAGLNALDRKAGGEARDFAFTVQAAKYLAVAMAYDDVIRVADLKVRGSRFERVRKEVGVKDDQILYMTEYMHPRMEEICGTLPKALGALDRKPAEAVQPSRSHRQQGAARADRDVLLVPQPLRGLGAAAHASRNAASHARNRASPSLACGRDRSHDCELSTRRRGLEQPPSGEGLFRHPRTRAVEIRPRHVGLADAQGPRGRRCLDAAAETGGTAR